jgi:hypothetical protein
MRTKGVRPRQGFAVEGRCEALEGRELLAAATAQVAMLGATTLDSKGVTVTYQVEGADLDSPPDLGVYRSASPSFGPDDVAMGDATAPAVDASGMPSTAVGVHTVTVALPGGLPPNPEHPYVVVVANPGAPGATDPGRAADFRVYTIGVIVHGGLQHTDAHHEGPPWEATMAGSLRSEGYDLVIPFDWVAESGHPGSAAKQIPRLAKIIDQAASLVPAGAPVDLHLIGHSEGTVIVSQALRHLAPSDGISRGFVELTLLDPHPASNATKQAQFSTTGGLLGGIARATISAYQSKAKDPAPYIPAIVDDAQVYYQRTPVALANETNGGLYNLWGVVPVAAAPGVPVHYANLTGSGISHSGVFSVHQWYQNDVVPLLGDGPAFVDPGALTASRTVPVSGPTSFAGTASPGASVSVFAAPGGSGDTVPIGRTVADARGHWSMVAGRGAPESGRFFARVRVPVDPGHPRVFVSSTARVATA